MKMNSPDQHGNYVHTMDNEHGGNAQDPRQNEMVRKTWAEWMQDVKLFIWNPGKKEVLGRDGKSWALILLFYFALYAFLTGMFALCIYGLLLTISPYVPTYRDRVFPPGLTIRPHVTGYYYSYSTSDESTWSAYSDNLHTFLEDYDDAKQMAKNVVCPSGQYFIQEGEEHEIRKACQFRRSQLQNCSGIEDPSFGFSQGKPCFILKMNRILGFKAGAGTPISVSCDIPKGNSSLMGAVNFYPANYFDLQYFPYYGKLTHVNYTSPLVAMHFTEVTKNTEVTIQCKIKGEDIINDHKTDRFLGRVIFILNIG
ncbi:protein ATP1B4 [Hyperolius riggenbachi]|uniref:protein ATP1B4 n=1 Tax=Hyperolius riggenbachi TaxID=752182 RepID=UPI0035A2A584